MMRWRNCLRIAAGLAALLCAPAMAQSDPAPQRQYPSMQQDAPAAAAGWQPVAPGAAPAPAPTTPVIRTPDAPAASAGYPSMRDSIGTQAAAESVPGLQPAYPSIRDGEGPQTMSSAPGIPGYRLGAADKVRVTVYGEDDLGGEFSVDGSGNLALPLIGQVPAMGRTLPDLEREIARRLADGYVNNPRVSAQVTDYRPFFIIGEVNKPGEYPFQSAMSVVTAVALAGGYTYRADDSDVYLRRSGATEEVEVPADATSTVNPGDTIRVAERFF